jgi:acetyl esterase/lipase
MPYTIIEDIEYETANGERGIGDLILPEHAKNAPVALTIHGGGWNKMDKYCWSGVSMLMADLGYAAFNINYRLLDHAPWPACGDDCLKAGQFLLDKGHESMEPLNTDKVIVIGGSAGGHLTMMTGLRLDPSRVKGIISVAGPADLMFRIERGEQEREQMGHFFQVDGEITNGMIIKASPINYVSENSPPLLCLHSVNDKLVLPEQSERIVKKYNELGLRGELFTFDGPGEQHGIWSEGSDPHRLLPNLEEKIGKFINSL